MKDVTHQDTEGRTWRRSDQDPYQDPAAQDDEDRCGSCGTTVGGTVPYWDCAETGEVRCLACPPNLASQR